MKRLKYLVFSLIFVFFACDKDNDLIDPSSQVKLTVKLNFEYYSGANLKAVKTFLSFGPDQPVLASEQKTNLNGQPGQVELVLKLGGSIAQQVIGQVIYLLAEVEFEVDGNNITKSANKELRISGGEQSTDFDFELLQIAEIEVTGHFQYGEFVVMDLFGVGLYNDPQTTPYSTIVFDYIEYDYNDWETPANLTIKLKLEGELATTNIGQIRWLLIRVIFKSGGPTWYTYLKTIELTLEAGKQELNVYFAHPPDN